MQIVCDLISLAKRHTERAPRCGIVTGSGGTCHRGGHEKCTRFSLLIGRQRHGRFTFPGLPGSDPVRRADGLGHDGEQGW